MASEEKQAENEIDTENLELEDQQVDDEMSDADLDGVAGAGPGGRTILLE